MGKIIGGSNRTRFVLCGCEGHLKWSTNRQSSSIVIKPLQIHLTCFNYYWIHFSQSALIQKNVPSQELKKYTSITLEDTSIANAPAGWHMSCKVWCFDSAFKNKNIPAS